jgi:SSS family solute:Na+ symporter
MSMAPNAVTLTVFLGLFALVTGLGFVASRWRAGDLTQLDEWGLGGRRFGTWVTWFLLGGDLYTAYTFIAVPALMFGAGAPGFFAVPYTILMYPLLFVAFPRLWSVAHRHGYVTAADFVRGRFGSRGLSLAIAITGIVATMPYIALQLVGMQVVLAALGINFQMNVPGFGAVDMPLLIAFAVLAFYTYSSGLRAPALIAVVKDMLVYITVFAAIIFIPMQLGGYGAVFEAVPQKTMLLAKGVGNNLGAEFAYATLALGSILALFLYPHAVTGLLSSSSRHVVRRNAMILPAYSLALALIALLGYMAIAAGVREDANYAEGFAAFGNNFAVPALFLKMFPAWFAGLAFAAIAIGALVPAAIMSIACANLFTRNIYKRVHQSQMHPGAGIQRRQDRVDRGEVRGADLRAGVAEHLRHPVAAAGRHLDVPDPAVGAAGAVHPLLPSHGAAGGLGDRSDHRHLDGVAARLQELDLHHCALRDRVPLPTPPSARLLLNLAVSYGLTLRSSTPWPSPVRRDETRPEDYL